MAARELIVGMHEHFDTDYFIGKHRLLLLVKLVFHGEPQDLEIMNSMEQLIE